MLDATKTILLRELETAQVLVEAVPELPGVSKTIYFAQIIAIGL